MPASIFSETLSNDLQELIFDYILDGRDLSRCYGVCQSWRTWLMDKGEAPWQRLCRFYGFPDTLTRNLQRKLRKYEAQQKEGNGFTPANFAYKEHYICQRDRLCRNCRKVKKQNLHYPIEYQRDGYSYPLCFQCRRKTYPMAILPTTEIIKQFRRVGINHLKVLQEQKLQHLQVSYGRTRGHGYMFRLVDVVKLAKHLVETEKETPSELVETEKETPSEKRPKKRCWREYMFRLVDVFKLAKHLVETEKETPSEKRPKKRRRKAVVSDVDAIHQQLKRTMVDVSESNKYGQKGLLQLY